jgi:hypothetical protein
MVGSGARGHPGQMIRDSRPEAWRTAVTYERPSGAGLRARRGPKLLNLELF